MEQFTDKDLVNTQEFADDSILKELKTLKLNKLILFGYNSVIKKIKKLYSILNLRKKKIF